MEAAMTRAILAAVLLGAAAVAAAAVADATRPADAPDASSPKAAAKSLFRAVSEGDRAGVRAALFAANAEQAALLDAMADLIVNGKRLGDAARDKFGAAGDPIGRGMLDPADLARIDAAAVKQSGDAATLDVPGQSRPMSFRRGGDGKWRLVVTDFGGALPQNIDMQTRLVRMMADAMDESAREVAAGKYSTPQAATAAIQKRLHEVMQTFYRPATTRATTGTTTAATQPQR
jgi:hypothetical protein